ncbi:MAG: hypothetical protein JRE14_03335 [Deltaproteobacteria bacterium]|nr:hypothetical protein [Deltaproteobacteria bacterium]
MTNEQKPTHMLRAILSADIKAHSHLMTDDEAFTIKTQKECQGIMSEQNPNYAHGNVSRKEI